MSTTMRWPDGNKNLAQFDPFLYASGDYTDKLDRVMSSGSSAPAMSPRLCGSWPAADASLEDERSTGDPSGRGAHVVELASGPAADAEYDWDDTAEEPFLWAHTLDPAADPPSGSPGPTHAAAERGAQGPAVCRRAAGTRRSQHPQPEPVRRAGTLVAVFGLAGLAVVSALWLAGYGQAKTAQRSAAPAVAPATPIAPPAQAPPEAVLEASVSEPASSDLPSEHVGEGAVGRPGPTARVAPASSETSPGIAGSASLATQAPAAALARPAAAAGDERAAARPATAAPTTRMDGGATLPVPSGGSWAVVVQSFGDPAEAEGRRRQVENHGVRAEIRRASVKGQLWHRVIVPGYSSRELARVAAAELGRRKLGEPWVLEPQ